MHLNTQNMYFLTKNKNFSIDTYYYEYILFTTLFHNLQITIKQLGLFHGFFYLDTYFRHFL
jgi:hypothetical protein